MNTNIAIVVGFDAEDEPKVLYVGRDYEKALNFLEEGQQPEGIHYIGFYRNITPTRRRQTGESVLLEQKRAEDAEKRAAEQRARAEAEAAAKAALAKAEREAAAARAQAKAAEVEKASNAKKLAEQAEILERIAAEARAKAQSAATDVTQANAAPAGSASGSASSELDPSSPATADPDQQEATEGTELAPGEVIDAPEKAAQQSRTPRRKR